MLLVSNFSLDCFLFFQESPGQEGLATCAEEQASGRARVSAEAQKEAEG